MSFKNTGMVALVSRPNDRLSGIIQTVTGPSYHLCHVRFEDAERIGEHYLWRSEEAGSDGKFCRILIQLDENQGIKIDKPRLPWLLWRSRLLQSGLSTTVTSSRSFLESKLAKTLQRLKELNASRQILDILPGDPA